MKILGGGQYVHMCIYFSFAVFFFSFDYFYRQFRKCEPRMERWIAVQRRNTGIANSSRYYFFFGPLFATTNRNNHTHVYEIGYHRTLLHCTENFSQERKK
jgi:hypothetical protein